MDRIKRLIATGLGTGYLPIAPGTWASAAVCAVFGLAAWASESNPYYVSGSMAVLAASACIACLALGRFAERLFGKKDPSRCTLDEWAGQAVAYLLLPLGGGQRDWLIVAAMGFVAFRLFDILKPPPARRLEKLPHGWGILTDDLVAAVYANAACQLLLRLWLLKGV
ncbi:unnamed protein product, partial [marine sediment metagenome]